MRPLTIAAKNLRTWAQLELELPHGIAAVVGPNGAGKSTLVHAIDLALFGTGAELRRAHTRGATDDELAIELDFEHAGAMYRVRRGYVVKGRGKPSLDFELHAAGSTWESLTRDTVAETQELLEETIGLSRQTFRASSYLAQGDGDAFTNADPRDRKAILLDALGVRVWDRLKDRATELRRRAEQAHAGAMQSVDALVGRHDELDGVTEELEAKRGAQSTAAAAVEGAQLRVTAAREELEAGLGTAAEKNLRGQAVAAALHETREADRRLRSIDEADGAILTHAGEARDDETLMKELRARIATIPHLEKFLELERQRHAAAQTEELADEILKSHRRELAELGRQQDSLVEHLERVDKELEELVVCPTCERELDEPAKEAAGRALRVRRASLEREQGVVLSKAKRAAERLLELEARADAAEAAGSELVKEISRLPLDDVSKTRPELALTEARQAERSLARIESSAGLRDRLTEELADRRRALEEAKAAFNEITGPDELALRAKLKVAEQQLERSRTVVSELDLEIARLELRVAERAGLEEQLTEARESERVAGADVELYRLAERAYGRDGIPALILETSAIPQLEAEANRIVSELGRDYRFELRTQRETQAGTVKEVLDVLVVTPTGEAAYEDFSGGERARIDVSLRIALARLLAGRRGADVRLLAIDEPAFLDDEGFELLAGVLRELVGEFETILVVSHVEALRDAFDSAIIVGGGADTNEPSRLEEVRAA